MLRAQVSGMEVGEGKEHTSSSHGVREADIKSGVCQRGEGHSLLACYIFRSAVFVAYCIFDLRV